MLLLPIVKVCEMQGQILTSNMFWHVNTSETNKSIMITFAKRLSMSVVPSVWLRENIFKTYSFTMQNYFAPNRDVIYNILKVQL